MRIVLIGPPGAGKGTQSQLLLEHLGVPHLSTGDELRNACRVGSPLCDEVRQYLDTGRLVPDAIISRLVFDRLQQPDCAVGCLFDGYPRTMGQAQALDEFLAARGQPLDGVIELRVDEYLLMQRMLGRKRGDDKPDIFRQRLIAYREETEPLVDYYQRQGKLQSVNGIGTTEEVFDRIEAALAQFRAGRPVETKRTEN